MTAWVQLFLDTPSESYDDAVRFWSAVTGWRPSTPRGEDGQFLTLLPSEGSAYVKVQSVEGPARVHLDLDSHDRPAAVATARAHGATYAWSYHDVEVMRSPGGLLLCHTLVEGSPALVRDGRSILDQVCIDVPAEHWEREVGFWQALTGRQVQAATRPEFLRLLADGQVRILLQRLEEPTGVVRAHPDLASADRAADTERHAALGADVVAVGDFWTVMTAPGGQVYCLTDRDPCG